MPLSGDEENENKTEAIRVDRKSSFTFSTTT